MIRSELVERVAELHPHLQHRDVERVVETIFAAIGDALARGARIEIRGFGSFAIKHREARTGRNPKTGVTVEVPRRTVSLLQDRQTSACEAERRALGSWPWQEFALANSFSNAETHADPEKNQHDVSEDVYSGHGEPRGEGEDLVQREWSQDQLEHARTISGSELRGIASATLTLRYHFWLVSSAETSAIH